MVTLRKLRIGCVPEHFSCPLLIGIESGILSAEIRFCPGGTGEMLSLLNEGIIDIAIALTEGILTNQLNENNSNCLIGTFVSSPLTWSIAMHSDESIGMSPTSKIGISRFGSGSHLMSAWMAKKFGWLKSNNPTVAATASSPIPFEFVVAKNIDGLLDGIATKRFDAFLWEYFTTKVYYDAGKVKCVGKVKAPWSAFMITAKRTFCENNVAAVDEFMQSLNVCIDHFMNQKQKSIEFILQNLPYSREDAELWFDSVDYSKDARQISEKVIVECQSLLREIGIVTESKSVYELCFTPTANIVP